MTLRERRALRQAIQDEIVQLDELIVTLSGSFQDIVAGQELVNTDDEHDPEGTTIAFERSQTKALLDQAETDRTDLRETLDRVDDEGFGVCEVCAEFIGVERLMALPATNRCVRCAI